MTRLYRIEASAVDPELSEGLAARAADPLWYLARQWQVGEFRGEDAATPVVARASIDVYRVDTFYPGRPGRSNGIGLHSDGTPPPLETLVEREPVPAQPLRARDRLESGLALLRRLRSVPDGDAIATALLDDERLRIGPRSLLDEGDAVGMRRLRLLARKSIDAVRLQKRIDEEGGVPKLPPFDEASQAVIEAVDAWLVAESSLLEHQPAVSKGTWRDRRQEYEFGVSADTGGPAPLILHAPEYPGGRLDWYHFDLRKSKLAFKESERQDITVLATPLVFSGQPAQRFWELEESKAYFGDLAGGQADLARSVLAAYAAVAGDDWFVIPCHVPANAFARISALDVIDNFSGFDEKGNYGADAWKSIPSTTEVDRRNGSENWRWQEIEGLADIDPDGVPTLFVPPVLASSREGEVLEEVCFRRDEGANLAWAIERIYQSRYRRPVERPYPGTLPDAAPEVEGDWTFSLGTTVPAHFVPLLPVRMKSGGTQMALRRGRMALTDTQATTDIKGTLLTPRRAFVLEESEVPEGGIRVTRRFQMARNAAGERFLWVGRRKRPATGPLPRSPLRFDHLDGYPRRRTRERGR